MQPSEHLEPGTILAGRYRIVRPLGSGGMGSVYLVEHLHTDQQLALKLLHSTVVQDEMALTRFRREARAPAKVGSDHVVQVTDADVAPELGGVPFLVMEWLRGSDLEDVVKQRGTLTPGDTVGYLRQAARALDKAHALGIVHRDLKPENLFLTMREDGTPWIKILDFGIAKLTKSDADPAGLKATGTGQIFGTPLYMAPEQIKAETERVAPHTDIWALGIIAHRLLLGREPWTAQTLTHLVAQIAYEAMPIPSEHGSSLGPAFDAWFLRCCAREPGDRFASAGAAVIALAKALDVEVTEGPTSLPLSPSSSKRVKPREAETAFSATAPARSAAEIASAPPAHKPTLTSGSHGRDRRPLVFAGIAFGAAGIVAGVVFMTRDNAPSSGLATSTTVEAPHADLAKSSGILAASPTTDPPIVTPSIASASPSAAASIAPITSASAAASGARADHAGAHTSPGKPPPHVPSATPVAAPPPAAPPPIATAAAPAPNDDPLGSRH